MNNIPYIFDDVVTTVILKSMNEQNLNWVKENIVYDDLIYFTRDEIKNTNDRLFINFIMFCEKKGKNIYNFLKLSDRETFYDLLDLIYEFSEEIVDHEEMALIFNENLDIITEYYEKDFNSVVEFIDKNLKKN